MHLLAIFLFILSVVDSPVIDRDAVDAAYSMKAITLIPAMPRYRSGHFSHYGQEPTDGTLAYQQHVGRLPEDISGYDGMIATLDCDHVGQEAWIRVEGSPWLNVLVFDCAGDKGTVEWMQQGNILGELSYYLAHDLGTLGRVAPGELSFNPP